MSHMKRNYVVGYDISDPRRLAKVARVMSGYGTRIQYSFFHCILSSRQKNRMKEQLGKVMNESEDQIIILPVTEKQVNEIECMGYRLVMNMEGVIII